MRVKGVYGRWQAMRQADHKAQMAEMAARVIGPMVGMRLAGPAEMVPVCGMPVHHDVTCPNCQGQGVGICGNRMTRKQFIWDGRCTECVMLAKM